MKKSILRLTCSLAAITMMLAFHYDAAVAALEPQLTIGTPEEIAAEHLALRILANPQLLAAKAAMRSKLLADPAAATQEGRDTLNRAVDFWTASLVMGEVASDPDRPVIVWGCEDTPHSWFGFDFPGAGIGGDNPDNIYRSSVLDGARRHEIHGHVPGNGPAQFSIELNRGGFGDVVLKPQNAHHLDMGNQLGMASNRDIKTDADGNFVVTVDADPTTGQSNHLSAKPGAMVLAFRDSLSDWRQTPLTLSIKRIDDAPSRASRTQAQIVAKTIGDLPQWISIWTGYKEAWLGNPAPNKLVGPLARDGGWGYGAGGRFDLKDDEAIVITLTTGGAKYTGFQSIDRWWMTLDARKYFLSRNNSQVTLNPDGSATYVVSIKDPGAPNWISTAGIHQGYLMIRWQNVPPGIDVSKLTRSYKLIKLANLKTEMPPETKWVPAIERAAELRQRAADFDSRLKH